MDMSAPYESFLASSFLGGKRAGQERFWGLLGVLPKSTGRFRGNFTAFTGQITTADNILDSSVSATIEATSIDTSNSMRDDHVRSVDFFDAENHPALTFVSSVLRQAGGEFFLAGNLTIRGTTKAVTLTLETPGFGANPQGGTKGRLLGNHRDQPHRLRGGLQRPDPRRRRRTGRKGSDRAGNRSRPEYLSSRTPAELPE
jgi:hypothetical protein